MERNITSIKPRPSAEIDWEEVRLVAARLNRLAEKIDEGTDSRTTHPARTALYGKTSAHLELAAAMLFNAAVRVAVHLDDEGADAATDGDWTAGAVSGDAQTD